METPSPPTKKRRVAKEEGVSRSSLDASKAAKSAEKESSQLLSLVESISSSLEQRKPSSADGVSTLLNHASSSILRLKAAQRSLCLSVGKNLSLTMESERKNVESKTLALQNLVYQREDLRRRIQSCREFSCPNLYRMACDELGSQSGISSGAGMNVDNNKEDACVDKFLSASDPVVDTGEKDDKTNSGNEVDKNEVQSPPSSFSHRNPERRSPIVQMLNSEINRRSDLRVQLESEQKKLEYLKRRIKEKRSFLDSIPRRILEMERASAGLQSFFLNSSLLASVTSSPPLLTGSERNDRIDASIKLNRPLYVLYVQLQSYLDSFGPSAKKSGQINKNIASIIPGTIKLHVVSGNKNYTTNTNDQNSLLKYDHSEVTLSIPLPDIAIGASSSGSDITTTSSSVIVIRFRYLPALHVVTAGVGEESSSSSSIGYSRLLKELFPRDRGSHLPNGCTAVHFATPTLDEVNQSTSGNDDGHNDNPAPQDQEQRQNDNVKLQEVSRQLQMSRDRPYYWCQYLSGILVPPDPNEEQSSKSSGLSTSMRIAPSTSAIVRRLLRRIRAHAALSTFLYVLERKKPNPIPRHPQYVSSLLIMAGRELSSHSCKLAGWTEIAPSKSKTTPTGSTIKSAGVDGEDSDGCKYYLATIKRKTSTLFATVKIHPAYPIVPPLWSLNLNNINNETSSHHPQNSWSETQGTLSSLEADISNSSQTKTTTDSLPPLYDATLGQIEAMVNADSHLFIVPDKEETYDWILMHQLHALFDCWEEVHKSTEIMSKERDNAGNLSSAWHPRTRRGRDRRHVGFELYCQGLFG